MMRKLLAALFVFVGLAASPAYAQGCGDQNPNCIVPTRPLNDSTNAAASTAFVENQIGSGVNIVNSVINSDGTLTISPTAGNVVGSLNLSHANTWVALQAFAANATYGANGGTLGQITLNGSSTGGGIIQVQAAAGTPTLTLGTNSGTPAVTASAPLAITPATGNATCATCATTTNGGALSATAPVALSAGGAISITGVAGQVLAGAGPAFTATPTLGTNGGTGGSLTLNGATSGASVASVSATGALNLRSPGLMTFQTNGAQTALAADTAQHFGYSAGILPTNNACTGFALATGATDVAGKVTFTATTTNCAINFGAAFVNAPFCVASVGAAGPVGVVATTSLLTVSFGGTSQTTMTWHCFGN